MKIDIRKSLAGLSLTGMGTLGAWGVGQYYIPSTQSDVAPIDEEKQPEIKTPEVSLSGSIKSSGKSPYLSNTTGGIFSGYLLDKNSQESTWSSRADSIKKASVKSPLFQSAKSSVTSTKNNLWLKNVCEQMYTYRQEQWKNPMSNQNLNTPEKTKALWDETWEYCSVSAKSEDKPQNWPYKNGTDY